MLYPWLSRFLGKKYCSDCITAPIAFLAFWTSSFGRESWNHSSIPRYICRYINHCFHIPGAKSSSWRKINAPAVVCPMHNRRNKLPFRSDDWHQVVLISPLRIAPRGKSSSLCAYAPYPSLLDTVHHLSSLAMIQEYKYSIQHQECAATQVDTFYSPHKSRPTTVTALDTLHSWYYDEIAVLSMSSP